MTNKKWNKEELIVAVKNNSTIAGVLRELGLSIHGGNYATIHAYVEEWQIDTSHWKGLSWCAGIKRPELENGQPLEEILINPSKYTNTWHLKKRLVKEVVFEDKCDNCSLCEWLGKPISLHLDHIDGNRRNNTIENLRLLCPNCHSQTPTYAGKKLLINKCQSCGVRTNKKVLCNKCKNEGPPDLREQTQNKAYKKRLNIKKCMNCGNFCNIKSKLCVSCSPNKKEKIEWPSVDELKQMVLETSYVAVGRLLGVSDNAIRKRIKNHK